MPPFAVDNSSPIIRKIPGVVDGIGASGTAVARIPPGATYTDLILECTIAGVAATRAQLETMLASMRFTVSGEEKWTLTAKQLIAIVEFYNSGLIGDTGYLWIPLERLWMNDLGPKVGPAYGTAGETSVQLEIDQDATSTIDGIVLHARISPKPETLGAHMRIVRLTPQIAATGVYYYDGLPKNPAERLYALHFQVPVVANFTNIAYIADEVRMIDAKPALLHQMLKTAYPNRTPQTAKLFCHLDFAGRNFDSDSVPLTMKQQILELTFATAAPNAVNILAEIGTVKPSA